jgi:hypothetical protein
MPNGVPPQPGSDLTRIESTGQWALTVRHGDQLQDEARRQGKDAQFDDEGTAHRTTSTSAIGRWLGTEHHTAR